MKLVATTLFLSKLVFSSENKYSSTCNDQGQLEIHIPYANAAISDLLNADAGDCTELKGPGGTPDDNHEYFHDKDNQKSILKIDIEACGLNKILEDEPTLRFGQYYMATANVTIGVTEEATSRDLIFYNAVLGAECGAKTDYTVSFDYSKKIDTHEETGCHEKSPDGQCIVAAFEEYDFTFKEYDETYETVIDAASHKASEMIYLQIESSNLPDNKVFSVKQCTFVDKIVDEESGVESVERYSMFDATTDCKNEYIDLSVGFKGGAVQIEHRLFLLTRGDHDSYALECDIKVCDKDDDGDCATWQNTCSGGDEEVNICEASNYTPDADDFIIGDSQQSIADYTGLPTSFYQSETGSAWLNTHYREHQQYQGHESNVMATDPAVATADSSLIRFSNDLWMRFSLPGADISTFDFGACYHQDRTCYNSGESIHNYATFIVGCGDESVCSPANFDWSTVIIFKADWVDDYRYATIFVKTSLFVKWEQCLANGYRSAVIDNVVFDDGESNSSGTRLE